MKKTDLKGLLACAAAIIALFAVMLPAGVLAAGTDGARSGGLITVKGADGLKLTTKRCLKLRMRPGTAIR